MDPLIFFYKLAKQNKILSVILHEHWSKKMHEIIFDSITNWYNLY